MPFRGNSTHSHFFPLLPSPPVRPRNLPQQPHTMKKQNWKPSELDKASAKLAKAGSGNLPSLPARKINRGGTDKQWQSYPLPKSTTSPFSVTWRESPTISGGIPDGSPAFAARNRIGGDQIHFSKWLHHGYGPVLEEAGLIYKPLFLGRLRRFRETLTWRF